MQISGEQSALSKSRFRANRNKKETLSVVKKLLYGSSEVQNVGATNEAEREQWSKYREGAFDHSAAAQLSMAHISTERRRMKAGMRKEGYLKITKTQISLVVKKQAIKRLNKRQGHLNYVKNLYGQCDNKKGVKFFRKSFESILYSQALSIYNYHIKKPKKFERKGKLKFESRKAFSKEPLNAEIV